MDNVWIARDKNGNLYAYLVKPVLYEGVEFLPSEPFSHDWLVLPKDYYPEVTFENSPLPLEVFLN